MEADTGDLLLFKGNNLACSAIRSLTNTDYDHVAMVLKYSDTPDQIYILEANSNRGVVIKTWQQLKRNVGKNKFYSMVVFRHVSFDRSEKAFQNLQIFMSQAEGLKYGLKGVFKGFSDIDPRNVEQGRSFFCSELIAKAFKNLGILINDESPSSDVIPGDFGQSRDS